jgi:hypothetical protein
MRRIVRGPLAALFLAHAIAHLAGFAWPWWVLEPLPTSPNDTALIGDVGMQAASVLWLAAAIGFVAAALAVMLGWSLWRKITAGAAITSLVLSVLCWPGSLLGVPINVAILLALWHTRPHAWTIGTTLGRV